MPYIAIKAYPKDEKTKQRLVEEINRVVLDVWGCPEKAISISLEEIEPSLWEETVVKNEVLPNKEKMYILDGERKKQ